MDKDDARSSETESFQMGKQRRKVRPIFSRLLALALVFLAVAITSRTTLFTDVKASISSYFHGPQKSKIGTGPTQISNLKTALDTFETDNGRYPTTEEGLDALVIRPASVGESWRQQMEEIPLDHWTRPFRYRCPGTRNPDSYDLDSAGPDGVFDTADDIHKDTLFMP